MGERPRKHHKDTEPGNHHDDHYHFLEGIEEDEFIDKKKNKLWITIASVILILLKLSFLIPLERLVSILKSKKISSEYIIELKNDGKISFTEEVYFELRQKYINTNTEFKICLLGNKTGETYEVNSYYYPRIFNADYDSVTSEGCNSQTIISMHSHPNVWCIFSAQDIKTYNLMKERNSNAFIGLM